MGDAPFSFVDLGSANGFFSLQAAYGYPNSLVIGIEGSVGVGNGTVGVSGTEDQIIATKAVQTHIRWAERLELPNCLLAPEVWDYKRVSALAGLGRPICDVLLSLSVIHHIDGVSGEQYKAANLTPVEGTVHLMAKLLELSPRHFIELPDTPWIEHVWNTYSSPREFLEAACRVSNRLWAFTGPLVVSEWYGRREVWLLEENICRNAIPWNGLKAIFPRVLSTTTPAAGSSNTAAAVRTAPRPAAGTAEGAPQSVPQPRGTQTTAQTAAPRGPPGGAPSRGPSTAPALPGTQPGRGLTLQEEIGAALLAAPTALIAAHVQLRDALAAADGVLKEAEALK